MPITISCSSLRFQLSASRPSTKGEEPERRTPREARVWEDGRGEAGRN